MKVAMLKTKKLLLAGVAFVATAFFAGLFSTMPVSVTTQAATLTSTQFQTDGASVRVFKREMDGSLTETTSQGIRFHVEMGNGYAVNGSDFTVTAMVLATSDLTIANNMLGFENRTGWNPAGNPDHYYFAITYTEGTNLWLNTPEGDLNGYWNDHPEKADSNYGIDIMEYIHINGKSIRSIVMDNKNMVRL